MPSIRRVATFLLPLIAWAGLATAAPVDPALFGSLDWRLLGPFRGGRVLAVSGVPGEPEHFYFGSVNGGVWESRNAGRTWQPIFDDQPIGSIGALAVAPSDPRVLYVGTGEADMRSDIAQGDGVYKSTDGGRTWRNVGLRDSQQVARILVHPDHPERVWVAALGHPYGPNPERGVFRSRDGGVTWERVLGEGEDVGAVDLAFEPGNPDVIYAALWQTRRTPWSVYPPSNGPGSGLWKSTDGGDRWTEITGNGLPEHPGRIGIAVAPSEPHRVYVVVDAEPGGGLYRSDDAGAHFLKTSGDPRIWGRGWYFGGLAVEPFDPDVVYSCNTNLYRSADGGTTFVPVEGDGTGDDYHVLWIDPEHPERRILGVDQGAVVSVDGGTTWSSWYNQPTAQLYHVITDRRFPYWVYGAQQDTGAAALPSRTNSRDGITLMQFRETTAGGESDSIAPDPMDPEIVYGGRVDRLDLRTEQTRAVPPGLDEPRHHPRTWTLPLVFSHRDPRVLYFGDHRVYRTEDGGEHWKAISPVLTREDPGTPPNLDPTTASLRPRPTPRLGVIYAIAPSRRADGDLWVGTDDGLVWRTRDEGAHWEDVTPAGLEPWSKVGILETSHFDAETAYAAVDRHRLDDFRPWVYRTRDGGAHWEEVSDGIPDGSFVNVVREDPVRRGLLYAGTEKGVYLSFDDGDSWQSLQLGLPVTSVRDIDVHDIDLVIATHGRGFWVMDDVTPLRQVDETVTAEPAWLARPAPAVRFRVASFLGTPLPLDEPRAENPPAGAVIDYYLRDAATEPVVLEIATTEGELVRRYTSDDEAPPVDLSQLGRAPQWVRPPSTLSAAVGMHRFVWPLRYAPPSPLADTPWTDGVWAPPGRYRVTLIVAGARYEQPLEVRPDPRLDLPAEAYAAEFELARAVESLQADVHPASREAARALVSLEARRAEAPPELADRLAALAERVGAVSGSVVSSNPANVWWIQPRELASLRWLDGALGTLLDVVDGADAAPGPDARAGYETLAPMAERVVASWKALRGGELVAVDEALEAAGLDPVLP